MPNKLITWIKSNILSSILLVLLFFTLFGRVVTRTLSGMVGSSSRNSYVGMDYGAAPAQFEGMAIATDSYSPSKSTTTSDRMVVTKSSISMHVKDVSDSIEEIKEAIEKNGGYFVNYNHNRGSKDQTATIKVRFPKEKLDYLLGFFREMSIRVVSENIQGTDITDQYMDIDRQLTRLESTMRRIEEINLNNEDVATIISVNNQINSLQSQIDSLKGRKNKMEGESETILMTIVLSTDEQALPYLPSDPWSPEAVFKRAFRSMIKTVQGLGGLAIWLFVYSPVILGLIILHSLIKKVIRRKRQKQA